MDKQTGTPKVLGILSIIFGSLLLLMSLFGLVATDELVSGMGGAMGGRAFQDYMATLRPWTTIWAVVMIVMAGSLLAIGIGQVRYRRWARGAAVVWAIVALMVVAAQLAFHFVVTAPAIERLLAGLGGSKLGSMLSGIGSSSIITTVILYSPYPIITLVLMRNPEVVEAMNT